jgi:hypothetical protein
MINICLTATTMFFKNWLKLSIYASLVLVITLCANLEKRKENKNMVEFSRSSIRHSRVRQGAKASHYTASSEQLDSLPVWLTELAQRDLPAAMNQAKLLSGEQKEISIKMILRATCRVDPEFVASELATSALSDTGMDEVANYLAREWPDPKRALEWADQKMTGKNRGAIVGKVLARVIRYDRERALSYIQDMPEGSPRDNAFSIMMSGWASVDLVSAINYTETIVDSKKAIGAMFSIANAWISQDPQGVANYLSHSKGDERLQVIAEIVVRKRVQNEDPLTVMEWAGSLPGGLGKNAMQSGIVAIAERDPNCAASYLEGVNNSSRFKLSSILAERWTIFDPVSAANWVGGCRKWAEQGDLISIVMENWLNSSPNDASQWLGTLPSGAARDAGILVLLRKEMANDPNSVSPWIELLSTPSKRDSEIARLISFYESNLLEVNK